MIIHVHTNLILMGIVSHPTDSLLASIAMLFLAEHSFRQHANLAKIVVNEQEPLVEHLVCTVILAGRIGDT